MKKETFATLIGQRILKKGDWVKFPLDEERKFCLGFDKYVERSHYEQKVPPACQFSNMGMLHVYTRYLGVDKCGAIKFRGEVSYVQVKMGGRLGFLHGPDELNRLSFELYNHMQYGIMSRSIMMEDIKKPFEQMTAVERDCWSDLIMAKKRYWMASRNVKARYNRESALELKTGYGDTISDQELVTDEGLEQFKEYYLCPIILCYELPENQIKVCLDQKHDGKTRGTAYEIVFE